jgi:hypothetical protein
LSSVRSANAEQPNNLSQSELPIPLPLKIWSCIELLRTLVGGKSNEQKNRKQDQKLRLLKLGRRVSKAMSCSRP